MSREKIDMSVMDNCQNLAESYGEICVQCNKCRRFDKEKQIEEMARTTCQMYCRQYEKTCAGVEVCNYKCLHYQRCEALYNKGYRKQSEGEWVWKMKIEPNAQNIKYCSVCDTECPSKNNYYLHPKYCLNCGAKMKGGVE